MSWSHLRATLLIVLGIVGAPIAAMAIPITLPDALTSDAVLIDFENIPTNGALVTSVPGSLTIGNVTFSSLTGNLSIFDIGVAGWAANGTEVNGRTLFPGGEPDSAIVIDFADPVREFLLGWGDPNFAGNSLLAFDTNGVLLESTNVAIGPPGGGHAAWIGFSRLNADIARIVVQPDQSLSSGDDYVIDNIYYTVPEPATLLFVLTGATVTVGSRFSRRRLKASDQMELR